MFRFDAELDGLGTGRFELFALTDISGECDDFTLVRILQPFKNDRGVSATRIGQDYFFDIAHKVL